MNESIISPTAGLTAAERQAAQRANASGLQPVVFAHGLCLLAGSWQPWAEVFEAAGYIALAPGWPGEPDTVAEANARPDAMAHQTLGHVVEHHAALVGLLQRKPLVVGHSLGGLVAQILAGRGLAAATVAVSPAPFRGVLSTSMSVLRATWPVLGNPANRHKAVALDAAHFRYAFANVVDEHEALDLYRRFAVPVACGPLFQAAMANVNPWSEAVVDTANAARGPLLIVAAEKDHVVPASACEAAFRMQQENPGLTESVCLRGRGHSIVVDSGWRQACDAALGFARRFVPPDMVEAAYLAHREDRRRAVA